MFKLTKNVEKEFHGYVSSKIQRKQPFAKIDPIRLKFLWKDFLCSGDFSLVESFIEEQVKEGFGNLVQNVIKEDSIFPEVRNRAFLEAASANGEPLVTDPFFDDLCFVYYCEHEQEKIYLSASLFNAFSSDRTARELAEENVLNDPYVWENDETFKKQNFYKTYFNPGDGSLLYFSIPDDRHILAHSLDEQEWTAELSASVVKEMKEKALELFVTSDSPVSSKVYLLTEGTVRYIV